MTTVLLFASILFGVGLEAEGFSKAGFPWIGILLGLLGVAWIVGVLRGWRWIPLLGLAVVDGTAAAGCFLGLPEAMLLLGVLFGLAAWDLSDFVVRLRLASREDDLPGLERAHLLRLLAAEVLAVLLAAAGVRLRLPLSFEWAALLTLVGMGGLWRMAHQLLP